MSRYADLGDALTLMMDSSLHQHWITEDIHQCILTPMDCDQYKIMRDHRGYPVAFCTWGFPTDDEIKLYQETQRFPISGYKSQGKNAWVIDFIAKKGYTLKGVRFFWKNFNQNNIFNVKWLRIEKMKVGWIN